MLIEASKLIFLSKSGDERLIRLFKAIEALAETVDVGKEVSYCIELHW